MLLIFQSESYGEWLIYMNQLYSEQRVALVSVWRRSKFTGNDVLFPDKTSNLHGAALNVTTHVSFIGVHMYIGQEVGGR